jgi:hypothetical protein
LSDSTEQCCLLFRGEEYYTTGAACLRRVRHRRRDQAVSAEPAAHSLKMMGSMMSDELIRELVSNTAVLFVGVPHQQMLAALTSHDTLLDVSGSSP